VKHALHKTLVAIMYFLLFFSPKGITGLHNDTALLFSVWQYFSLIILEVSSLVFIGTQFHFTPNLV